MPLPIHRGIVAETGLRIMSAHLLTRLIPPPGNDNDDEEDLAEIIVYQGPPRCALDGDAAVEAQRAGCVWCKRITVHADGSETEREPGIA